MNNFKCKSFNQSVVANIMSGRQTQDRRPLKPQPPTIFGDKSLLSAATKAGLKMSGSQVGDIIGVKEKLIRWCESMSLDYPYYAVDKTPVVPDRKFIDLYEGLRQPWCWKGNTRQSNHMPKWAIRTFLKVTRVRFEQDEGVWYEVTEFEKLKNKP